MNKVLKGCLVSVSVLFGLFIIGVTLIVLYLLSPNDIKFETNPISYELINNKLQFNYDIPQKIKNQSKGKIVYQGIYTSSGGFDKTVVYKQINKTTNVFKLEKKLPINKIDLDRIKNNSFIPEIPNNPMFYIPDDKEISSGNSLTIYSKVDSVNLKLNKGYYSISYKTVDKEGTFSEIIIYDKESQLLYLTRIRYFAFQ